MTRPEPMPEEDVPQEAMSMGSQNGHGHEHDTHYHGEPSRVLDDQPLPETVVFYESGLTLSPVPGDEITKRIERWLSQLEGQGHVRQAYVGSDRSVESSGEIDLHTEENQIIDPFREDFEGFPESLLEEPGILFLPSRLLISEAAWTDFKANDVTVNWLSVVPDPKQETDLPRMIVLSDWITEIGTDIPEVRSTGVTPGVFYVKGESLTVFSEIAESGTDLEVVLSEFLGREGEKLRPGFLRGREWTFES